MVSLSKRSEAHGRVATIRRGFAALALVVVAGMPPGPARAADQDQPPESTDARAIAGEARHIFPQETQYRIGVEDVLFISVWRDADLTRDVPVRPDGKISLPLIQDVTAVGKTPAELAQDIRDRLKDYLSSPSVTVVVREINSLKVYLVGEVARPGPIVIRSKTRLLQAIAMAGGVTPFGGKKGVMVYRKGPSGDDERVIELSYDKIIKGKRPDLDIVLEAGDTVIVR